MTVLIQEINSCVLHPLDKLQSLHMTQSPSHMGSPGFATDGVTRGILLCLHFDVGSNHHINSSPTSYMYLQIYHIYYSVTHIIQLHNQNSNSAHTRNQLRVLHLLNSAKFTPN